MTRRTFDGQIEAAATTSESTEAIPSPLVRTPHAAPASEAAVVLSVDARPAPRAGLTVALRTAGHRVLAAWDAASALELMARERPAAAILHRSVADRVLRHVRAAAPGLPIIVYGHDSVALGAIQPIGDNGVAHIADESPRRLCEAVACTLTGVRAVERLRHEQELRGLALVQLCHTLRAPLDVIQGYAEMLRETPEGGDAKLLLDGLTCAVTNAMKLTREHLAVASLEAHTAAVRREPVEIDPLLEDLRRTAARPLAGRRTRLVAGASCRGALLYSDGDKLRALLAQLLARAAESSPRGVIRLSVAGTADATVFELVDRPVAASRARLASADALGDALDNGPGLELAQRLATLLGARIGTRRGPTGAVVFTVRIPSPLTLPTAEVAWGTLH